MWVVEKYGVDSIRLVPNGLLCRDFVNIVMSLQDP
jgi:hypothetical protein